MNNIIEKIKNNKKLVIIAAASAVAAITLVIVIITLLSGPKTINITDYVSVEEFIGYDGYGTVVYEIDVDKFEDDLFEGEKLSDIPGAKRLFKTEEKAKKLFDIKIKNNGSLSNGDTVEIEVKYDSKNTFDCEIIDGTITKKVKGLEEATTIDLFENVEVEFSGISKSARLNITHGDTDLEIDFPSVSYTYENEGNLANGDVVVVTATVDDYEYEKERYLEYGYVFPETQEKEYTVEGLPTFISKEGITGGFFEEMMTEANDIMFMFNSHRVTINNTYIYFGECDDDEGYDTEIIVVFDYYDTTYGDEIRAISFSDYYETLENGEVEYKYTYKRVFDIAGFFDDAMSEEQVFEKVKVEYPDFTITKVQ